MQHAKRIIKKKKEGPDKGSAVNEKEYKKCRRLAKYILRSKKNLHESKVAGNGRHL